MSHIRNKIYTREQLQKRRQEWYDEKLKVVFTNGCFDLLHPGHVLYLESAKGKGDRLIVALNSDASVRRLKGTERPIQSEGARATVMAALESVDAVVLFEEDTPLNLISEIVPDVLVKGGDWSTDQIVGSSVVLDRGGEVHSLMFEEGHSTTSIVEKIRHHEGQ